MQKKYQCIKAIVKSERGDDTQTLEGYEILVGRALEADLIFNWNGLSRRHAMIFLREGEIWLRDLSKQGVEVNGQKVGKEGDYKYNSGEEIRFGSMPDQVFLELVNETREDKSVLQESATTLLVKKIDIEKEKKALEAASAEKPLDEDSDDEKSYEELRSAHGDKVRQTLHFEGKIWRRLAMMAGTVVILVLAVTAYKKNEFADKKVTQNEKDLMRFVSSATKAPRPAPMVPSMNQPMIFANKPFMKNPVMAAPQPSMEKLMAALAAKPAVNPEAVEPVKPSPVPVQAPAAKEAAKDSIFRATYTDNVLYTDNYLQFEKSQKSKDQWRGKLSETLKKMKLKEKNAKDFLKEEGQLVGALEKLALAKKSADKASNIKKMRQLESASEKKLQAMVGGKKNFTNIQTLKKELYGKQAKSLRAISSDQK